MVKRDDAKKFLANVADDKAFFVHNGPVLKNLLDLENALHTMHDDVFKFHANKDKNDFSNWISAVVGDKVLAMDILTSRTRESTMKAIKNRVHSLKKMAG